MMFGSKKTIPCVRVENAKQLLKEGLGCYIGGIPEWLPEYDAIAEWLTFNRCKGLLAVGDPGRGKTRICMDVIPDILRSIGIECFCVSSYAMSRNFDEILKATALVIDDAGVEDRASFYGERRDLFMEVVDNAERNGVLLIVTTNMTINELKQRYGNRVVDRLHEIVIPIVFKGSSFRGIPVKQPFYAYGLAFDTEQEMNDFCQKQEEIHQGLLDGKYKANDSYVEEADYYGEPLVVRDGIVYLYKESQ